MKEEHEFHIRLVVEGPVTKARYRELAKALEWRLNQDQGDIYSFPGVTHHYALLRPLSSDAQNVRRWLKHLVGMSRTVIKALDAEMKKPATRERGERVAKLTNALEFASDQAWHFGLGNRLDGSKPGRSSRGQRKGSRR